MRYSEQQETERFELTVLVAAALAGTMIAVSILIGTALWPFLMQVL
jgi:hypothetical protein